ncbi:MAG: 3-dehydroquinate synthase [Saprospiraceae bacterium]|nr:3-dehydroquinate synthase [Saprospiraceae bacterium]MDW8483689.1 3-dehydroquinate synthase family protein [Saprospiraceae bacterium]
MNKPDFIVNGCSVWIGSLLETFSAWLQENRAEYSNEFWIIDSNAHAAWRETVEAFASGKPHYTVGALNAYVPGRNEVYKSLVTCEDIWGAMLAAGLDRKALAVLFGGGVVGDMGGFCAATYKRGIDFIFIPTTLLSMTDAAIGGKVGLDFMGVKNALGVFCQPKAVFVDPVFLQTLPLREWRSGMAEVVKHAYIGSPELLHHLCEGKFIRGIQTHTQEEWMRLLRASIAVKARIVNEDPFEEGLRTVLNFGHTFGHGIESYFLSIGHPITHGEAVAIGLLCEMEAPSEADIALLRPLLPPTALSEVIWPFVWTFMRQDKKNIDRRVTLAIPGDQPFSVRKIPLTAIEAEQRWQRFLHLIEAV